MCSHSTRPAERLSSASRMSTSSEPQPRLAHPASRVCVLLQPTHGLCPPGLWAPSLCPPHRDRERGRPGRPRRLWGRVSPVSGPGFCARASGVRRGPRCTCHTQSPPEGTHTTGSHGLVESAVLWSSVPGDTVRVPRGGGTQEHRQWCSPALGFPGGPVGVSFALVLAASC